MDIPILRRLNTGMYYAWNPSIKRRVYFGKDPTKAKHRYAAFIASLGGPPALPPASSMTVADAVEAFRRHAREKYTRPSERHRYATAITAVANLYGPQPAATFRAKALRDVRTRLLSGGKKPRSRAYINKLVRAIQTAWRWLACEELVPAEAAASVCMVRALGVGDGGKERAPVLPPEPGIVSATLPHLPPLVRAMVQVQLLTGARPGEICRMRWEEISREPDQPVQLAGTGRTVAALRCGETVVWMYAPSTHKTAKRGKTRVVPVGPQAMGLLLPYVDDQNPTGPVFRTRLDTIYRSDSYARAVERGCVKAGVAHWHPNQLRHAAASAVAEAFSFDAAGAMLGHSGNSTATSIYAEQAIRKAAEVAAKMG